jgi:hypothetical protein
MSRIIFPDPAVWTRNETKENTVTEEPAFLVPPTLAIGLPPDTVPITGTEAQFFLTPDGEGKLVAQLALHTDEMGWYRITFAADTFKSLLAQATGLASMTPEQTAVIARELNREEQ